MNILKYSLKSPLAAVGVFLLLLSACAKERDVKPVIPDGKRILKSDLSGTYLYLRTFSDVRFAGLPVFTGLYAEQNQLVQFEIKELSLDIVSIDPLYKDDSDIEVNKVLASFPIEHIDVLRKQNPDGEDTHEEEVTTDRRVWQERDYIKVDLTQDKLDIIPASMVKSTDISDHIRIEKQQGAINFEVTKHVTDGTLITSRYSFLKFQPEGRSYTQREYPKELQKRIGVFKTRTFEFDKFGRVTKDQLTDYMNRWDTNKKVVYHLSENFPEHLKKTTYEVFADWNKAFRASTGQDVLELREYSGQQVGDLRNNMVYYVADDVAARLLGYGPSFTNPRTGEIVKADVFLYGGSLKRSIYRERKWAENMGEELRAKIEGGGPGVGLGTLSGGLGLNPILEMIKNVGFEPAGVGGIHNQPPLQQPLLTQLKEAFDPAALLSKFRSGGEYAKHQQWLTTLDNNVLEPIRAEGLVGEMSDEELEIRIFTPLLSHELGHNLGLRHNFKASADKVHFDEGAKSSSVMDYGFLASHEPLVAGPYDRAFIEVVYGQDTEKQEEVLAENYYFCTDEDTWDPADVLCNRFDAGANTVEMLEDIFKRYQASYFFNNVFVEEAFPNLDTQEYINRLFRYLQPIRMAFDHANEILELTKEPPQTEQEFANLMLNLWQLLGERIVADKDNPEPLELTLQNGQVLKLDVQKVQPILLEAQIARSLAYQALESIVTESQRPLYDGYDPFFNEIQYRGVLFDKLVGLLMLSSRTNDPLGQGQLRTVYQAQPEALGALFSDLLSNTKKNAEGVRELDINDINIREFALDELRSLGSIGLEGAEAMELLWTKQVDSSVVNRAVKEYQAIVAINEQLAKGLKSEVEAEITAVKEKIVELQTKLADPEISEEMKVELEAQLELENGNLSSLEEKLANALSEQQVEALHSQKSEHQSKIDELTEGEEAGNLFQLAKIRLQLQKLQSEVLIGNILESLTEEEKAAKETQIKALEAERELINYSDIRQVGQHLMAKIDLRPVAQLDTATGLLMRYNINTLDDVSEVYLITKTHFEGLLEGETDPNKIQMYRQVIDILTDRIVLFHRYVEREKRYVGRLYRIYNPQ